MSKRSRTALMLMFLVFAPLASWVWKDSVLWGTASVHYVRSPESDSSRYVMQLHSHRWKRDNRGDRLIVRKISWYEDTGMVRSQGRDRETFWRRDGSIEFQSSRYPPGAYGG